MQVPDQVPLVERSHLYAPVRYGCDDGTDVGDVVSAFVGAGEGDAIGVFVSAVVVAMRATPRHAWQSSTPSSSAARKPCRRVGITALDVMSAVRRTGRKSAEINASFSKSEI